MHDTFFRPLPEDICDLDLDVSSEGELMEQAPPPSQKPKIVAITPGKATMRLASPWTDEAKDIVRKFWGKMSAARIAELIPGVDSRNAVISVAHRMGLPKPGLGQRPPPSDCIAPVKRSQGTPWTPADVERLKALCTAGKTYDEASEALGRSKSSIKHATKQYKIAPPVTAIAAARRAAQVLQAQAQAQARAEALGSGMETEGETPGMRLAPDGFPVVTIVELEPSMCHWPIDTNAGVCYCGRKPIAAQPSGAPSSYCAKHVAIAFIPTRRQQAERTQIYLSKIA